MLALIPFIGVIVPYVACGGLLWIIAHFLAPIGSEIPLSRGIAAVFLMGVVSFLSKIFLGPLIGDWRWLVELAVEVLVVMGIFRLPFLRAIVAVFIYWLVVIVAVYFLFIRPQETKPSAAVGEIFMSA